MPTILITSMGGAGSKNLVDTLRLFDTAGEYRVIGTHFDPYELVKSDLPREDLFIVPRAAEVADYVDAHARIIAREGVDVLIANSDKEVASLAPHLDRIACRHLIPSGPMVDAVQDKLGLHTILARHGCPVVRNVPVQGMGHLAEAVQAVPKDAEGRFWIRLRQGAGSQGATWMYTAGQAAKWIELWSELRGCKPEDFVLAPFLPGRDYCVALLYQDGELSVGKAYERLRYLTGGISISGMGSTPSASRAVSDTLPIKVSALAVEAVAREYGVAPHGYYQLDMKCDAAGQPYVTEINIGRFPMTSPQFDRVGRYNQFELYLKLLLNPEERLPRGVMDLDPGVVMLRSVDFPYVFTTDADLERIAARQG